MSRYGQALLWAGGFAVAALMAYTLAFDTGPGHPRGRAGSGREAIRVAVFYPERVLWQEFRQGARLCARKGLAGLVEEADGSVTLATPRRRRLVRFELHDVRGLRETRDEVDRLLREPRPPLAFVGSSNTVLTRAVAEALRASAGGGVGGVPVLLVPWASAILSGRPEPGEGPSNLLDILPGRTFRFCPNNQLQADLLVRRLAAEDSGRPPGRAVLVVDRRDPYSVDLAACFHRAVEDAAPDAEIVERADSLSLPVLHDPSMLPSPTEESVAESIWRDAEAQPRGRTTWVVLPLQEEPTRRMLTALIRHARRGLRPGDVPVRVVCGDGIGFSVLAPLAGRCPFPVWCSSPASVPAAARAVGQGISPDTQVPAEIVSALVRCLDLPDAQPATADRLRDGLAGLRLDADSPAAFGRSLAFGRSGERIGVDLGHVLSVRPDRTTVEAVSRTPAGAWDEPRPLEPSPVAFRP